MRSVARASVFLLGLGVVGAHAPAALAEPVERLWFVDGGRPVEVLRRGATDEVAVPAAPDLRGRWSRVELTYPGRGAVSALVDETAIVTLEPSARADVEGALADAGVELVKPLMAEAGLYLVRDTIGGDGVDAAVRLGAAASRARGVRQAIPNLYLRVKSTGAFTPNDTRFGGQWFFENLGMTDAWGLWQGAASDTIVVVDTGCDMTHPDLAAKMDAGLDVIDDDTDPSPVVTENVAEHGTACAGLSAAITDNAEGVAGACPLCRLRCVRAINDQSLPVSKNVEAFQFALDTNASVVTNSWGFVEIMPVPQPLADAINLVFDTGRGGKGAIVVFAMGNEDREVGVEELAGVRGVLGVGAITNIDQATSFTNFGAPVDVVAPTGTLTTDISGAPGGDKGDYTSSFGGTSSACPIVAGIMGLLVSAAPNKTSQELYDLVVQTTRVAPYAEPDAQGHDPIYGYGIVDPVKALKTALGLPTGEGGGGAGGGAPTDDGSSDDGCSCSVPGDEGDVGGSFAGLPLAAVGLYALARRARRRRARDTA